MAAQSGKNDDRDLVSIPIAIPISISISMAVWPQHLRSGTLSGVACNAWLKLLGIFIQIAIKIGIEIVPLIAVDGLILGAVAGVMINASSVVELNRGQFLRPL